jgi:hypothetical protein
MPLIIPRHILNQQNLQITPIGPSKAAGIQTPPSNEGDDSWFGPGGYPVGGSWETYRTVKLS